MSDNQDLPCPVSDLLVVDRLRALGVVPHYFGLGFIQMKIDDVWRVHVWVPEWPTIPGAENELHDHRYGFESHVLKGALVHELFALGATDAAAEGSGDWLELIEVTCKPGETDVPMVQGFVRPQFIGRFEVHTGGQYALGTEAFHRSTPVGPTVTLVKRGPVARKNARVLRPVGSSFSCPFALDTSVEACWAKVEEIYAA
jgi:hypothetical protein